MEVIGIIETQMEERIGFYWAGPAQEGTKPGCIWLDFGLWFKAMGRNQANLLAQLIKDSGLGLYTLKGPARMTNIMVCRNGKG